MEVEDHPNKGNNCRYMYDMILYSWHSTWFLELASHLPSTRIYTTRKGANAATFINSQDLSPKVRIIIHREAKAPPFFSKAKDWWVDTKRLRRSTSVLCIFMLNRWIICSRIFTFNALANLLTFWELVYMWPIYLSYRVEALTFC